MPAKKSPARAKPARRAAKAAPRPKDPVLAPYLGVNDADGAIAWYKKAFGAKEKMRMPGPDGKVLHAEVVLLGQTFYLSDIFPGGDTVDPARAGASVTIHLQHRTAPKLWARAVEAGAKVTMPFADQFWGDQYGKLLDPYGHSWSLACKSKLSKKELKALEEKQMAEMSAWLASQT